MLTARGQSGALTRLEGDGHGVAVGEAAADGVGVGDAEGVAAANGVGVGVGDGEASGWLLPQAAISNAHTAQRKVARRVRKAVRISCSCACARW
jgi:hypothetical protein